MSYQVIARKWRPQSFEEVTGQEVITHTLRNAIEHDRLHHAYLFSGARGVGKTTTARLLAKALNCHKTEKPNLTPCRVGDADICPSCLEISESRSMDVLEIDAASHTGIENVRETIIDSININPARDRYKVFIIDEVHQLSRSAFNALLKTLEEPPSNVVFVMATTELHKVPDTILSRCQEFQFRTIPISKIFARLKTIAEAEKIDISDDALREIARSGEGSMRDAQSNFDQVISFSGDRIEVDDVVDALGFASIDMMASVVRAIAGRDPKAILGVAEDLIVRGQDLRNFCRDLLSIFRDLLVFKVASDSEQLFEGSMLGRDVLKELSDPFSESDLLRFFNSLGETETKLKDATQTRYTFEIGLMKLVEIGRLKDIEGILGRLSALEKGGSSAASGTASENSAAAEKKTLVSEEPLENKRSAPTPAAISPDPPLVPRVPESLKPAFEPPSSVSVSPAAIIEAMPVRLPPIPSEELEHIEDKWLDQAFEMRLMETGDDLAPIPGAAKFAEALVGSAAAVVAEQANGSAAAVAPAIDIAAYMPAYEEVQDGEIPELPAGATEEQLLTYAERHPAVQRALRIFRAKIIDVKPASNNTEPAN